MTCRACREDKPLTEFYPRRRQCKVCHIERVREWQRANWGPAPQPRWKRKLYDLAGQRIAQRRAA